MTAIDDLAKAVARYRTAKPALKAAMRASATEIAKGLQTERDALVARMEQRWAWCAAQWRMDLDALTGWSEHPRFFEREDALLDDLKRYEAIEDALREAAAALWGAAA